MVVDVGFPQMLRDDIGMRLMIVFHDWVVVLVGMSGRQVLPLAAMPKVVHYVSVLVGVNDRVMGVHPGLPLLTLLRVRKPAQSPWLSRLRR